MTQNRIKQLGLTNSAMKLLILLETRNLLNGPAPATFSCGAVRVQGINPNFVNKE